MASIEDVEQFLQEFKLKMGIWEVLFLNRTKNTQTLSDLEITAASRKNILYGLESEDYSEGPLEDKMINGSHMWVFGKHIKGQEVYIKITLGNPNRSVICISFHLAEYQMNYPLK